MLKKSLIIVVCALLPEVFYADNEDIKKNIVLIINHFSLPKNENKIIHDNYQTRINNFFKVPSEFYQVIHKERDQKHGRLLLFGKTKNHVEKTASIAIDYYIQPNQFEAVRQMASIMCYSSAPLDIILANYKRIDLDLGEICLINKSFDEKGKKFINDKGRCFFIRNGVLFAVSIINQNVEFWPILQLIDKIVQENKTTE